MSVETQAGAAKAPAGARPLLELRGVSKRFGAVQALDSVDFHVDAGEVVALVGDNGAGKSTLIKTITGVGPADAGTFTFDGQTVTIHSPHDSAVLGIAAVYQDLALCDNLDVVENMFLGREVRSGPALAPIDEIAMEKRGAPAARLAVRPHAEVGAHARSARSPAASARPSRSPARCWASRGW